MFLLGFFSSLVLTTVFCSSVSVVYVTLIVGVSSYYYRTYWIFVRFMVLLSLAIRAYPFYHIGISMPLEARYYQPFINLAAFRIVIGGIFFFTHSLINYTSYCLMAEYHLTNVPGMLDFLHLGIWNDGQPTLLIVSTVVGLALNRFIIFNSYYWTYVALIRPRFYPRYRPWMNLKLFHGCAGIAVLFIIFVTYLLAIQVLIHTHPDAPFVGFYKERFPIVEVYKQRFWRS